MNLTLLCRQIYKQKSIIFAKANKKTMLSKAKIKFIRSLSQKKERYEQRLFIAEGNKLVNDTLPFFKCRLLIATDKWLSQHDTSTCNEVIEATPDEIIKASLMQSPQDVIALYEMPQYSITPETLKDKLVLALDCVQDPGNLGTIVRIADWYGIDTILCSEGCADIYNPKTIQATMGALARVKIAYVNLAETLKNINKPIYGTFLDGENIYKTSLSNDAVIVMGNEGNGISKEIEAIVTHKILLPPYPANSETVESLNVAVATAITCAEFRRALVVG